MEEKQKEQPTENPTDSQPVGPAPGQQPDIIQQPELTQEQLVHSLNVLMNALIGVLVDKKVLTEQDIHDKVVQGFGEKREL